MYSAYPPTIEKMYSLQQVLFCIHKILFVMIFRISLFFKKCLDIHSFQFDICSLVENTTICPLLPEDGGPLPVFFKLPISEISEIDDHKSVTILLFFSFLSVLLACLSYWKPILGHSLTSLLVYFQCSGHYLIPQSTFLIVTIVSLYQIKTQG